MPSHLPENLVREILQREVQSDRMSQLRNLRLIRDECRKDVNAFMEFVWPSVDVKYTQQASLHVEMQKHIDDHRLAGIMVAQCHLKTTQALGRILWELGRNPELIIKIVSSENDRAQERVSSLKTIIEANKRLQFVFPDLKKHEVTDLWGNTAFTVARKSQVKDPTVEACGVLTSGTGSRADIILFDDVVDMRNALLAPELMPKVIWMIDNVWMKLLGPKGRCMYLAIPWHPDDATHSLLKRPSWKFFVRGVNSKNDPIWPEAWDREALDEKEREDADSFQRGFRLCITDGLNSVLDKTCRRQFTSDQNRPDVRIESWDFAPSQTGKSDRVAECTIDVFLATRRIVVRPPRIFKGLEIQSLLQAVKNVHAEDKGTFALFQAVNFEVWMSQLVASDEHRIPFETYTPKFGKTQRMALVKPWFVSGAVHFFDTPENHEFADRVFRFPGISKPDDVDAMMAGIEKATSVFTGVISPEEASSSGEHGEITGAMLANDPEDDDDSGGSKRSMLRRLIW